MTYFEIAMCLLLSFVSIVLAKQAWLDFNSACLAGLFIFASAAAISGAAYIAMRFL